MRGGRPDIWRLPHGHASKILSPGLTGRILGTTAGCARRSNGSNAPLAGSEFQSWVHA